MSAGAIQPVGEPASGARAGERIGRFTILGELGRGAYGVVYRARDDELEREVAVKQLTRANRSDETLAEARVLARFNHPNIVTIYEVGRASGGVFVAMELVEGESLRAWIERERSVAEIIAAFLGAGEGLAAAHGEQVAHGDFKPENAIVGADGRVRVLDFGIASYSPDTASAASQARGTPAYMAPELWSGSRSSARSDQFAFCVSLWEALHGARPFDGATSFALALSVTRGELPPPRRRVPSRIQRALARGLSVDPAARWPDMRALLRQLEPRRRGVTLAVVGIGVAIGVGALVGQRLQGAALCEPEPLVERVSTRFAAGGESAEGELEAITRYARGWESAQAEACAGSPTPTRISQLACLQRDREALLGLVDAMAAGQLTGSSARRSIARLPRIDECSDASFLSSAFPSPEDAALREDVEDARKRLSRLSATAFAMRPEVADAAFSALSEEARALEFPALELDVELARIHHSAVRLASSETKSSLRALQLRALSEGLWVHAVRATAQLVTTSKEADPDGGRLAEAEALAAHLPLHLRDLELLPARRNAARVHIEFGRYELAERLLAQCRATVDEVFPGTTQDFELVTTEALLLWRTGKFDPAITMLEDNLEKARALLGPESHIAYEFLVDLSGIEQERGNAARAIERMRETVRWIERADGMDATRLAPLLNNLGLALAREGQHEEAIAIYRRAESIWRADLGDESIQLAFVDTNLGDTYAAMGRHEEAMALLDRALERRREQLGPDHPYTIYTQLSRARLLLRAGAVEEALTAAREAARRREALYGERSWLLSEARVVLARAYWLNGQAERARAEAGRAEAGLSEGGAEPERVRADLRALLRAMAPREE